MFRANSIAVEDIAKSNSRDEMRVRIGAADGQHYVARYSTMLIEGRWWIDAMRWRLTKRRPSAFSRRVSATTHVAKVAAASGRDCGARGIDSACRGA